MRLVNGIGGVFLFTNNVKRLVEWYRDSLGMVPVAETLAHLQSKGVPIDKAEDSTYGKFAWVTDPDGNKIELWEAAPETT